MRISGLPTKNLKGFDFTCLSKLFGIGSFDPMMTHEYSLSKQVLCVRYVQTQSNPFRVIGFEHRETRLDHPNLLFKKA